MNKTAWMIAAFALVAPVAPAGATTIESAFENTLVVVTSDGSQLRYFFEPDGSFTIFTPDGERVSGTWSQDGDRLCMSTGDAEPSCAPYIDDKNVGDTWQQRGINDESITVSIVAGRPEE